MAEDKDRFTKEETFVLGDMRPILRTRPAYEIWSIDLEKFIDGINRTDGTYDR